MELFSRRRLILVPTYPIVNQIWLLQFLHSPSCYVFSLTQQLTLWQIQA